MSTPAAVTATPGGAQRSVPTPAPGAPTPAASSDAESSLTVQQIVARQEDHFALIKNAQGVAVHTEVRFNEQGQAQAPQVQYIFFAYEGPRSVTLAMPAEAARAYKGSQGQIPWAHITAAHHVTGDAVYIIQKPENGTTAPTVYTTPLNPAVHENNPLVSFHLRHISNEQVPLRELARAIPNMPQRPQVYDIRQDGKKMLRVEFANANTPGERLYYIIDPSRGYLPVEITRMSGQRPLSTSKIIIGHTPDGTWVPARRERVMYDGNGRIVSRQNWHYEYLAVNQGLAPKALSLMYFNLPLNTQVQVIDAKQGMGQNPGAGVQSQQRPVSTPVQVSTPIPAPTRAVPAPRRVPLN